MITILLSFTVLMGMMIHPTLSFFVVRKTNSRQFSLHQQKPQQLVSDIPVEERGFGVGIDLGTTNSAVAVLSEDGIPKIITVPNNGQTIPSVVSYTAKLHEDDLEIAVGAEAIKREAASYTLNKNNDNDVTTCCYRNVKRVMGMGGSTAAISVEVVPHLLVRTAKERRKGRSMGKHKSTVQPSLTQQLEEAEKSPARLLCPALKQLNKSTKEEEENTIIPTISPEEVSSQVLKHLLQVAEDYYVSIHDDNDDRPKKNCKITRAVVGVPAYFNDAQRSATIRACELAGVPKVRLLREPEAAALAYGIGREQALQQKQQQQLKQQSKKKTKNDVIEEELVLVFDLGGGTFDVSVLTVCDGLMEVIATSGNNMLGGSDFDARIAEFLSKSMKVKSTSSSTTTTTTNIDEKNYWKEGGEVADVMVKSAEAVRIYLSNNKVANLIIPITGEGWLKIENPTDIILKDDTMISNIDPSTHVVCQLTRKKMENLCTDEFQALLRPVREVAIMAGALLPGDASPSAVEAILQMEEEMEDLAQNDSLLLEFDSFFDEKSGVAKEKKETDNDEISEDMLLQLKAIDLKQQKKAQQRGRKRARNLAKDEKKFREQKKRAAEGAQSDNSNIKVRDGINGRKISQVVLVGGATRMPTVGRLLAAVTGVVPQRTVNPDEAVALGCAVQVGILDGDQGVTGGLQVLSPIEAAMLRALAKKRGLDVEDDDDFDEFDEEIFY